MTHVIRLLCLANGEASPLDDLYLSAYDPEWLFKASSDGRLVKTLRAEADPTNALHFASERDAIALIQSVSPNCPRRLDGHANRPLTAFSILIMPLAEALRLEEKLARNKHKY